MSKSQTRPPLDIVNVVIFVGLPLAALRTQSKMLEYSLKMQRKRLCLWMEQLQLQQAQLA